jgi:hypothetical protein
MRLPRPYTLLTHKEGRMGALAVSYLINYQILHVLRRGTKAESLWAVDLNAAQTVIFWLICKCSVI